MAGPARPVGPDEPLAAVSFLVTEGCTDCGDCAPRCPTGAIRAGAPYAIDPGRCIDCGACGVACRDEAILDAEGHLAVFHEPRDRPLAEVDPEGCVGCAICVFSCPFAALRLGPHPGGGHFGIAVLVAEACVGCAICEMDCPYDAVRVDAPKRAA